MARGITLQRFAESTEVVSNRDAFRLRILATDPENMPAEIFVHRDNVLNPLAIPVHTAAEFCAVASVDDLATLPVNEPNELTSRYYRKDSVDILITSRDLLTETWTLIQEEVGILIQAMNQKDKLVLAETKRIGDDETTSLSVTI